LHKLLQNKISVYVYNIVSKDGYVIKLVVEILREGKKG